MDKRKKVVRIDEPQSLEVIERWNRNAAVVFRAEVDVNIQGEVYSGRHGAGSRVSAIEGAFRDALSRVFRLARVEKFSNNGDCVDLEKKSTKAIVVKVLAHYRKHVTVDLSHRETQ